MLSKVLGRRSPAVCMSGDGAAAPMNAFCSLTTVLCTKITGMYTTLCDMSYVLLTALFFAVGVSASSVLPLCLFLRPLFCCTCLAALVLLLYFSFFVLCACFQPTTNKNLPGFFYPRGGETGVSTPGADSITGTKISSHIGRGSLKIARWKR